MSVTSLSWPRGVENTSYKYLDRAWRWVTFGYWLRTWPWKSYWQKKNFDFGSDYNFSDPYSKSTGDTKLGYLWTTRGRGRFDQFN